ncbi:tetratricopeptide repeat protein [Nocardia sp. NPDC058666]|uniref:tetratricopeptide repeat protein n=1 Tax=Nocardia sp. NPDC058666 TaxID=3346587 RepID=UPI003657B6A8
MTDNNGGDFGADAQGRRRLRQVFRGIGLSDRELVAPMAVEILRQGHHRPRQAWRLANFLTQEAVADRFNQRAVDLEAPMINSRIAAIEAWPNGRRPSRPTVRILKILAEIYGTTWDQLVDATDIAHLPLYVTAELAEAIAARTGSGFQTGRASGRELPTDLFGFVGRSGQLDEINRRVIEHLHDRGPSVHVIAGPMGVGKTALARHARTAFARRYADNSLWEDLHGHTPGTNPRDPADVLEQLLLQVGVTPEAIASDLAGRANQWHEVMRDKRCFIVFDNALDSKQVRYLQPQSSGCFVLITSRGRLTGLAGAAPLSLEVMTDDEARELLVRLACLGPDHDVEAVTQILRTAGRLPLAIKLIAGQIAQYGPEMLAECAREFVQQTAALKSAPPDDPGGESAAEHILGWFTAEDQSLLAAFELSYDRLGDPLQRRVLRLIGWFPGREITAEAVALMAQISLAAAKSVLRSLSEAGFIDRSVRAGHCYRAHDVVRLCARMRAEQENPPGDHAATIARLIDGYLEKAREQVVPSTRRPDQIRRYSRLPEVFEAAELDPEAAQEWLTVERANLLACIAAARPTSQTAELAKLLAQPLWNLGCWTDARRLYDTLRDIAVTVKDRPAEAKALLQLGRIDQIGGYYDDSESSLQHASVIAREIDDPHLRADILCERGQTAWLDGAHAESEEFYTEALVLARDIDYPPAVSDAHQGIGHVRRLECRYGEATSHFVTAGEIAESIDDPWRCASVRWGHGEVARRLGDNATAMDDYTAALRMARKIGNEITVGDALRGLGHLGRLARDPIASAYFAESLEISNRLYDRYGKTWSLWGQGNLDRDAGRWESSRRCYTEGLEIAEAIKLSLARVDHHRGLGHIEREYGDYAAAIAHYEASLRIAEDVNDPNGQGDALRALGSVMHLQGRQAEAGELLRAALRCYDAIGVPASERTRELLREYGCD